MARGFSMVALLVALLAVGYERFFDVAAAEAGSSPADREVYQSVEGGNGLPPTPAP
jgi:hypothetical protein